MVSTLTLLVGQLLLLADPQQTPATPNLDAPAVHDVEQKIVERTNAERVRFGLRPLRLDPRLLLSARRHNSWMTRNRNLQHTGQAVAENIAAGQRTSAEAISSWMNSPGHRANILNASYTRIGVSAYTAADGTVYWTQQFQE